MTRVCSIRATTSCDHLQLHQGVSVRIQATRREYLTINKGEKCLGFHVAFTHCLQLAGNRLCDTLHCPWCSEAETKRANFWTFYLFKQHWELMNKNHLYILWGSYLFIFWNQDKFSLNWNVWFHLTSTFRYKYIIDECNVICQLLNFIWKSNNLLPNFCFFCELLPVQLDANTS